jgi:hypothetical protein
MTGDGHVSVRLVFVPETESAGGPVNLLKRLSLAASLVLIICAGFAGPAAAAKGGNNANVEQCKQGGSTGLRNLGQCISSGAKGVPPPASLEFIRPTATYGCGDFTCWGFIEWSGLKVPSEITLSGNNLDPFAPPIIVESASTMHQGLNLACGGNISDVVVTGTTAAGTKISSSPPVNSPCG